MIANDERRPLYHVNQLVTIEGKDGRFPVCAAYRLENIYVYELAGMPDFLVKERRLSPDALEARQCDR